MGIMLPPVSQVTNTRINHTQHHRNRSLDSALQRIPEVSNWTCGFYVSHSHARLILTLGVCVRLSVYISSVWIRAVSYNVLGNIYIFALSL